MTRNLYMSFISRVNNIKIRDKILMLILSSTIFFIILISFFTYIKVRSIVNESSGNLMMNALSQINSNVDYNIKKSEVSINSFYSGGEIKSLITSNKDKYKDENSYLKAIKQQVFSFKTSNDNITDLRIFSFNAEIPKDNTSVYSMSEIESQSWVKSLFKNRESDSLYWTNAGDGTWNKFSYVPTIYCYKAVFNEINNNPMAILRMDVSSESVFEVINSVTFGKSGAVFVAKSNGNLVYYNNKKIDLGNFKSKIAEVVANGGQEGSFTADIDGKKEFLAFNKNNKLGWYVIGFIPQNEINGKSDSIRSFIILISITICILGFGIAFFFSSLLTKRITVLSKAIHAVGKGNFNVAVNISGNDEIGQVSYHFNLMVRRIKELVSKVEEQYKRESVLLNEKYELEIMRKEAELCALQTQINPHFLYNTLEMIKGLLFSEDPKGNIINATQALSDMFRYNLNTGYIVKVKDEIEHIKNYLIIQNFRFDNGVTLINKIDEEGLNFNIVRFTFQPIIENAIAHGFRTIKTDSSICFSLKMTNGKLVISIEDNGIGIEEEKLEVIKDRLLKDEYSFKAERKGGLGIYNVNGRIKRCFGPEYGIDIVSVRGVGTKVFISLPGNKNVQ